MYRWPGFIAFVLVGELAGHSSFGQYPGYQPENPGSLLRSELVAGSKTIRSIASHFTQEKHLSLLQEVILSEGNFWYKREDKVRLEYTKPFRYLLLMNGDQMVVRDESKETRVNMQSSKLYRQINHIIMDCVQGTILDNKDFSSRLFQDATTGLIELTPRTQALKEFFQTIIVVVDRKDYSVHSIDLREPGGDHTLLQFSRKELNGKLDDEIFTH